MALELLDELISYFVKNTTNIEEHKDNSDLNLKFCLIEDVPELYKDIAVMLHNQWPKLGTISRRIAWYEQRYESYQNEKLYGSSTNPNKYRDEFPYFLLLIDEDKLTSHKYIVGHACLPSWTELNNNGKIVTCTELMIHPNYRKNKIRKYFS